MPVLTEGLIRCIAGPYVLSVDSGSCQNATVFAYGVTGSGKTHVRD